MLTHVMLVRVLILSLLSALIPHADARPTTIPLPIPHLTETTLLQVSRSVQGGPFSESLMCDLATTRALAQLQIRIQRDLITQRITSDELATAVPPKTIRTWDATHHRCLVTVQIEIPILPRSNAQPWRSPAVSCCTSSISKHTRARRHPCRPVVTYTEKESAMLTLTLAVLILTLFLALFFPALLRYLRAVRLPPVHALTISISVATRLARTSDEHSS